MRELSWILLSLMVVVILVGCGEEKENVVKEEVRKENTGLAQEIIWEKDGAKMVLIPAGSFEMGDHLDGMKRAQPVHKVELDAFYIDIYEVTVGQYKQFLLETEHQQPSWNWIKKYSPTDDHPMINVTWHDAVAYTEWAGKQLPTEAQWEYAARGGLAGKRYPWGNKKADGSLCNFADKNAPHDFFGIDRIADDGYRYTAPVGSYPANGYGLYDIAGNVWEWCSDWYDENYYSDLPVQNPQGPDLSPINLRVLRGGSWGNNTPYLRVADRIYYAPNARHAYRGFRCVSGSD